MLNNIAGVPDSPDDLVSVDPSLEPLIRQRIEEGESELSRIRQLLLGEILPPILEAESLASSLAATCEGEACHHLGKAEAVIDKLTGKMLKDAWGTLTSAYGVLAHLGVTYPSQEEVIYGLQTGDYLGGMPSVGGSNPANVVGAGSYSPAGVAPDGTPEIATSGMPSKYSTGLPLDAPENTSPAVSNSGGYDPIRQPIGVSGPKGIDDTGSGPGVSVSGGGTPKNGNVANPVTGGGLPPIYTVQTSPTIPAGSLGISVPILHQFGVACTDSSSGPFWSKNTSDESHGPVMAGLLTTVATVNEQPLTGFDVYGANWLQNRTPRDVAIVGTMTVQGEPGPFYFYDGTGNTWTATISDQFAKTFIRAIPMASGVFQLCAFACDPCLAPVAPCYTGDGSTDPDHPPLVPPAAPPPTTAPPPYVPPSANDTDCAGVLPLIPRFDSNALCNKSDRDALEMNRRLNELMGAEKPAVPVSGTRPNSTIGGAIFDALSAILGTGMLIFFSPMNWFFWRLRRVLQRMTCFSGCNIDKLMPIVPTVWVMSVLNRLSGGILNFVCVPLTHWLNKNCPYSLPTAEQATAAYMSGVIDKELWKCWVEANGVRFDPQDSLMFAGRARPNINEITTLFLREKISEEEWKTSMRENGVVYETDRDRFKALVQAQPGLDDVIRFLIRDVADPQVEAQFQLSKDFEKKWQGPLIKYAQAQGISDELALNYWKAHWQLPSNTQLFRINALYGPHRDDIPEDKRIGPTDIRDTIELNDMLPMWVDKLLASSFAQLTRVDIKKAFKQGVLSEQEVYYKFQDIGYDPKNAQILVNMVKQDMLNSAGVIAGLPTKKTYLDAFIRGETTEQELAEKLTSLGVKPEEILVMLPKAKEAKRLKIVTAQIAAVKKLFLHGQIDEQDAVSKLTTVNVDPQAASDLIDRWIETRVGKSKMASVANLCSWASNGWISGQDHIKALTRLGYSESDAAMLAGECDQKMREKLAKQSEQLLKQQQAAQEKELKRQQQQAEKLLKLLREAVDTYWKAELTEAKILDKVDKYFADAKKQSKAPPSETPSQSA